MLNEQVICADGVIRTKLEVAIQRLRSFEPPEGYFVAFSGGKDSQCVYHLCEMAGVKFEAHYNVTSVDPPELIKFIKSNYPEVIFNVPHDAEGKRISMWSLIEQKMMPPMRIARYCCQALKEQNGEGRIVVTGVRWAESARRAKSHGAVTMIGKPKDTQKNALGLNANIKKTKSGGIILNLDNAAERRLVEQCYRTRKTLVNPIIDWNEADVWQYLNEIVKVPHCCLYDEGFLQLGCIGCPMQGSKKMEKDFARWPKYKALYLKAFERMQAARRGKGLETKWENAEEVFAWWVGDA